MKPTRRLLSLTLSLMIVSNAIAQESDSNAAAQANNPLANLTAFNVQGYHIGDLTGTPNSAQQWWLRYAKPFDFAGGKWLLRASLPFNSFPVGAGGSTEHGLGDASVFAAYLIDTGNPAITATHAMREAGSRCGRVITRMSRATSITT